MKTIQKYLPIFFILLGVLGGTFTYLLKNETRRAIGWEYQRTQFGGVFYKDMKEKDDFLPNPVSQVYAYPVAIDSGLTGAGIGTGIFSAVCLLAGVYLLPKQGNIKIDEI